MKNNQMAEFIKQCREKAKLSQADVAKELGFATSQFVSNWERGKSSPPVKYFKALGRIYNIDPRRLLDIHLEDVFKWDTEKITKKFQRSK